MHFSAWTLPEHRIIFVFTEMCVVILMVIMNINFNPHGGDGVMGKYRYSNKLE